jgi:hypothetical protein
MTITEPFVEKTINGLPAVKGKLSGEVALDEDIVKQIAQIALVNHLGKIYSFEYYDIDSKFNSTESHDNMNRFILTFDISQNLSRATNESNQSLIYDNPELGYSFEYPADWAKEESLGERTLISPKLSTNDIAPESIVVTSEVLFPRISLEEYNDVSMNVLRSQLTNLKLNESSDVTLSGYPAHQVTYTYYYDGTELKNLQIWTVADDRA